MKIWLRLNSLIFKAYILICDYGISMLICWYCVKNVRFWSFSGPYFPAFGENAEWYKISLLFSPYAGKYGPEKQRIGTFFTPCFVWCWTTEHLSPSMRHYKKSRVLATITKLSDYINCCDYYFRKFWLLNFAVFLEDRNAGKKVAVLTNGWWR